MITLPIPWHILCILDVIVVLSIQAKPSYSSRQDRKEHGWIIFWGQVWGWPDGTNKVEPSGGHSVHPGQVMNPRLDFALCQSYPPLRVTIQPLLFSLMSHYRTSSIPHNPPYTQTAKPQIPYSLTCQDVIDDILLGLIQPSFLNVGCKHELTAKFIISHHALPSTMTKWFQVQWMSLLSSSLSMWIC